jgi:hypothetical protein
MKKMSSFGDDIRRISKYHELLDAIRQLSTKVEQGSGTPVPGTRGIAYNDYVKGVSSTGQSSTNGIIDKSGDIGGGIGEGAGEDTVKDYPTDGGSPRTGGVGHMGGSDDIASGDNTSKDGWYDAESLLNNKKDNYGKSPPEIAGDIVINTITGLTTGSRAMLIHMNDPVLSMLAPSSWSGSFDPGTDTSWDSDYYYEIVGAYALNAEGSTLASAASIAAEATVGYYNAGNNSIVTGCSPSSHTGTTSGTQYFTITFRNVSSGAISSYEYNATWYRHSCISAGNPSTGCAIVAPKNSWYPDLGLTQLALLTALGPIVAPFNMGNIGQWVPHPEDLNIPLQFKNGASILDLESIATGLKVRIGALMGGGWYMYNRNPASSNLPVGAVTNQSVFTADSKNRPAGFITPNELATRLPI